MKPLFFVCFFFVLVLTGSAQTPSRLRQLTMDGGLPTNAVNDIVQDMRGFIWIGTANGLCRYDGGTVVNYQDSDVQLDVKALLAYDEKSILVGTSQTVYVFRFDTETFEQLPLDKPVSVSSMALDKDGLLWIATHGQGVVCYQADEEETKQYDLHEVNGKVEKVYVDNNNQLWALTDNEQLPVWQLNRSSDTFAPLSMQSQQPFQPTAVLSTSDNQLWMGTQGDGLMLCHRDRMLEPMPMAGTGHAQHVNALFELSPTRLLLGCDDGLWLFDTNLHTFSLYLQQRFVNTMIRDHEGGLWVGTDYSGVSYMSPIAHRFDSYPVGPTNRLCEDRQGRLWTTREDGGLDCHPKGHPEQTLNSYPGQAQLAKVHAHALCMDGDDLWIGTFSDGVYVYSTVTGQLRHYESSDSERSLYDPNSCTLLRDRKGTIWVATMEGLCRYQRGSDSFERVVQVTSVPIDIDEDRDGRLWVATQGDGIWQYNPADGQLKSFHHDSENSTSLSHSMVNCIFIDGKERIWVATQGGLCRYDEQRQCFQRIWLNVPRRGISSITEQQGVLWMSGDCGVLRLDGDLELQRFTRQDGLDSELFQPNSVLSGSDGRIYFGSISGFNAFYPQQIKVNRQSSAVYITQLEINNQPIEVGNWHLLEALSDIDKLDLWYKDQVITLSFASLSYCSPEKNMYAYMLEGFDKQWNYVGHERRATYTNLEPGTYTFLVKATNNDGVWSEHVARLIIEVHPPYWWSIYAKILYVVLFVVLITAFVRFRLYMNNRRHRKEIERLNEAKQEEMRRARTEFFTTIAHEIRTPVSLIIGPLDTLKANLEKTNATKADFDTLSVIDRNAHRLLDLVNQLLDFRKVEQPNQLMNFAPQNMKELIGAVVNNFETIFNLNGRQLIVNYPEEHFTAIVDREGMTKVLSNLLSNANKYTKDTITLSCYELPEKKEFCIEVSDNGSGISRQDQQRVFDPFFQTADRKPGTGIGLSIVKKMVELHHGTVSVKSELGQGTTFRVVMPVAQAFSGEQTPIGKRAESDGQETKAAQTDVQQTTSAKKPNMLIVEDNQDMQTFLVTTFMDRYEVTWARDGSEAVKILRESLIVKDGQATPQSTFDIVISDWMMEQMDGPELCSRMRQNAGTKHIPFILLTAKTDSQSKVEAMQAGVDAFIEKPFAVKYLEACISNLLARQER